MARIVLTFDDGWVAHYNIVRPVLLKYGFGATLFVTGNWVNRPAHVSEIQVKELNDDGFEIGNHLYNHVNMRNSSDVGIRRQIRRCENKLHNWGVPKPVSLAYPGFHYDDRIREVVREQGYLYGRSGLGKDTSVKDYLRGGSGREYAGEDPMDVYCKGILGLDYGFAQFKEDVDSIQRCGVFAFHNLGGPEDVDIMAETFQECMEYLYGKGHEVAALRDM